MTEIKQESLFKDVLEKGDKINTYLVRLLCEKNLKITFAESCTGGMLSEKLTAVDGSSACFDGGYVTYSNEQKMRLLNVKPDTLKDFGAVSYQTALEMSIGVKKEFNVDIGIGVTGIAGPGGGTAEKPVGLVYISLCCNTHHLFCKLNLTGDRDTVRDSAYRHAYAMAIQAVENRLLFV